MHDKPPTNRPAPEDQPPIEITADMLRGWPLPSPDEAGDKEQRGRVLVVGGAVEMPGAVILAGTAGLRAGAGKLRIATCHSIATAVGVAVPEARVFSLPETAAGAIDPSAAGQVAGYSKAVQAILIGPGMIDATAVAQFVRELVGSISETTLILDAEAMSFLKDDPDALHHLGGRVVLTPHAGEMAGMLGVDLSDVKHDPLGLVRDAAARWQAVVALKGSETLIAMPEGRIYSFRGGNVGLATSGSGDTLAGVIAGLAARGAGVDQAAAWGVYLHGTAGDRLAKRIGRLGFLARELLAEIPPLMMALEGER